MNILFLNHKQKQCGVYQYGLRTFNILSKSTKYKFLYAEVENEEEYYAVLRQLPFRGVIYNYHNLTMAWLGRQHLNPNIKHYGLHHEGSKPTHIGFNCLLHVDSTFADKGNEHYLPRPLFDKKWWTKEIFPHVPIISSFGFGFGHKGFGSVVKMVNDQFDEAIVRLHIPRAYYGDKNGEATAGVVPGCLAEVKKPGIRLEITHDFLDDHQLLRFLSESDINVFLYHETYNTGLSSVIDYALSVPVPIAINKTSMFRHIAIPEICVENKTLPEIIAQGTGVLDVFIDAWSNANFIRRYEDILDKTL